MKALAALLLTGCFIEPRERVQHDASVVDGRVDATGDATTPITNNVVFVTSTTQLTTSATSPEAALMAADDVCQQRAAAGGLVGTFVAWLSTSNHPATTRLGSARGWVRRDGKPFGDVMSDILMGVIYYPADLDESGAIVDDSVATATTTQGTTSMTFDCDDLSSTSSNFIYTGVTTSAMAHWTQDNASACGAALRFYCFETDRVATFDKPALSGKLAFLTTASFTPALSRADADTLCRNEAATASATAGKTFDALLATTTESASQRFTVDTARPWVRLDGVKVSTDLTTLEAPINLTQHLVYQTEEVFIGATSLVAKGAVNTTCNNWATGTMAEVTNASYMDVGRNEGSTIGDCSPRPIYCVEP